MIKEFLAKLRKKSKPYYRTGWDLNNQATSLLWTGELSSSDEAQEKKEDLRIEKKPVEVFKEIFTEEPKLDLVSLDKKIEMVEKRISVLRDFVGGNISDDMEALGFLKARKKLLKTKIEFRWATTNLKSIQDLVGKYKLRMVDFASYAKNVPMEAVDELEKFMAQYEKVRDDQPVLKLIIDEGGKEAKKDPILLASSPFGKWFYILGAWDKEVEIVDDLIYNGK